MNLDGLQQRDSFISIILFFSCFSVHDYAKKGSRFVFFDFFSLTNISNALV